MELNAVRKFLAFTTMEVVMGKDQNKDEFATRFVSQAAVEGAPIHLNSLPYEDALPIAIDRMAQNDATGAVYLGTRRAGDLQFIRVPVNHFDESTLGEAVEIIIIDGGNTSGDAWKHTFFTITRHHSFVYEA